MEMAQFRALMEEMDVDGDRRLLHAGKSKARSDPFSPVKEEDIAKTQANMDTAHQLDAKQREDELKHDKKAQQALEEQANEKHKEEQKRLQAEIAQLQSQNQNQDDITGTDMTLRPCAKGEQQRRVAGEPDCLGTFPLFPRISDGGEGSTVERTRDIRQGIGDSQLNDAGRRAITISTILAGSGVKMKVTDASSDALTFAQEPVLFQKEQPRASSQGELKEELKEKPRADSVDQLKKHITLSSDFITATASELREIDSGPNLGHDQIHDFDDIHALLNAISLTTIDDAKGVNSSEPGRDQSSYLPGSSWGHAPNITNITMWTSFDKKATTGLVIGYEDVANLLSSCSDGGLTCGNYDKEVLTHLLWMGKVERKTNPGVIGDGPEATCRHARRCYELGISYSLGSRREAEPKGRIDGRSFVGPFPVRRLASWTSSIA